HSGPVRSADGRGEVTSRGGSMGTQQSRQGHGRQGSRQQGQQSDRRPEQQRGDTGRQQTQQNVHGEGNYAASRHYDDATKKFTESGRVEPAARAAAPRSDADAREMAAAEAEGKRHSK